jgi:hypothetical protein
MRFPIQEFDVREKSPYSSEKYQILDVTNPWEQWFIQ